MVDVNKLDNRVGGRLPGWEFSEDVGDGATSDPLVIPPLRGSRISVTLVAGANTGKIQATTSPDADVVAGTATWSDWPNGNSTGTVSNVLVGPITALRCVSVSGGVSWEVVI